MINFSWSDFNLAVDKLVLWIYNGPFGMPGKIYGIPRGGIPLAVALSNKLNIPLSNKIDDRTLVVDDIVDSGATLSKISGHAFSVCLHVKPHASLRPDYYVDEIDDWVVYPWEVNDSSGVEDNIKRIIEWVGENPNRDGLVDTPKRVAKSFKFLTSGYQLNPTDMMTVFDSDGYDQMIVLRDIEMYSLCEHHLLPFIGKAHVAYIPNNKIIGVSKLARLVDMYSRRFQIQERIGQQVTKVIMSYLDPLGAACVIEAAHLCMRMRGVSKQNSVMVTSSLRGVFIEDSKRGDSARQELIRLVGVGGGVL